MGLQTTTITDFRKGIKAYMDEVIDEHETIIIPRKNKGVVVMSLDEYNSIIETAYLLSNPKNADRLHESIAQARNGKLIKKEILE